MKEFLKKFYSFSKSEQRSIIALFILLILILIVRFNIEYFIEPEIPSTDRINEVQKRLDSIKQLAENKKNYPSNLNKNGLSQFNKNTDSLFTFNPNNLSKEGWMKLGLSEKQALAILKYVSGRTVFKKKEDLKKVFVISEKFYKKIEPYISIPQNTNEPIFIENEKEEKSEIKNEKEEQKRLNLKLELNSADTSALKALKGIGSYLAKKIIQYREKLGGYYSIYQLKEIENLDFQSVYENAELIMIDTSFVKKLNINKISSSSLAKHPYFSRNVALALINYRDNHGRFTSVSDLKKCLLVDDALLKKISPYISIE